jgi:hypothetical protein
MLSFLLQKRHLKPKIDCRNNGKWKLQTYFSLYYDFAFINLLKMWQSFSVTIQTVSLFFTYFATATHYVIFLVYLIFIK